MAVLCEYLGMPDEYDDRRAQATRDRPQGHRDRDRQQRVRSVNILIRHTARRLVDTDGDFTSVLINHPAQLTDDEVSQHLRLVLLAAYEATANLLANVLRVVLTDPRFRAQLNGGQMTVPQAVEQSRGRAAVQRGPLRLFRQAGHGVGRPGDPPGDGLILGIAPGNIDPKVRPATSRPT